MKKLNLFTRVIIPVVILGAIVTLIGVKYLNNFIENTIQDEINQKISTKSNYTLNYVESEFKLLFYLYGTSSKDYKTQELISKKDVINGLRKYNKKVSDIVYILSEQDSISLSSLDLDSSAIKTILEADKTSIVLDSKNYEIKKLYFKPWDWTIVYLLDTTSFTKILHQNQSLLFGIIFMLLLVVIVAIILTFKLYIEKPINALLNHMENIAKGKYKPIDQFYNTKEIDLLLSHVNAMTKSIEQREIDFKGLIEKTKEKEDYLTDILDSQKSIILVNNTIEMLRANSSFFSFFSEYKTLKDFKKEHDCVCDYFEKEEGYVYKYEDKNWVEYIIENADQMHKVQIKRNNQLYIFVVEAIKSRKYNRIIVSLTDITELEKSNNVLSEYKKAVDAGAIISKTDLKGRITYVNDIFIKLSGYSKEELIGKNHNIVRSPNSPKEVFENLWKTIQSKQIWRGNIENATKIGTYYYVNATIVPILDSSGEIAEYLSLRYDITEQVKAKEKAQKAEEAKSLFLANMSHEVRTPLNAIIGFTNILHNLELPTKASKYVNIVDQSAKNLLGIINDVLDISKIESGKLVIEKVDFNLQQDVESIINLFEARASEKSIVLFCHCDSKIPKTIISDSLRLNQVLSNLLSNAIKFSNHDSTVELRVDLIDKSESACKIKFSVKDSGIGVEKDKLDLIFQAFSQADDSTSREYGGTGLGLSISSRIIEELGSHIELESEVGLGSTFSFELTCDIAKTDKNVDTEDTDTNRYKHFSGKILIAEDHAINRELISALLDLRSIEYDFAHNGNEAVKMFLESKYDLILMDMNMPEKNGIEASLEIMEIEKQKNLTHTPIFALTANAIAGYKEKILKNGIDGYLSKPIEEAKLDEVFGTYLHSEEVDISYDIAQSSEEMSLDSKIVQRIVASFCSTVDSDMDLLKNAIDTDNFEEILNFSHKIKGAALNLRMHSISKFAASIEKQAAEKNDTSIEKEFKNLKKAVKFVQELDF